MTGAGEGGQDHEPTWVVVVNDEEQYSIWAVAKELPPGWRAVGVSGSKDDCLAHIDRVWTDMRPLTLRNLMAGDQESPAVAGGSRSDRR